MLVSDFVLSAWNLSMKGPSERLKYDLRRLWECPVCKRRERTTGATTFCHCACQSRQLAGKLVPMTLLEDGVHRIGQATTTESAESAPIIDE